ncbi:hypothetical protein UB33_02365 [Photobacterium angustum]|uniref:nuclear transport factor 2 family protein n=1 Tax=Photobacterium angustum TaxID=661 RepID=UPI0005DA8F1C|nr:DUF4440 domain-containing protein [Photobacterium angustum]KJF94692.1 hypothetical protein UB39_09560 [Photobacterium angustum]KJG07772.1 hypothetical protein UB33_02365 [Photobacterium angustum]PSV94702.1 DUF4440 domain-containing protein [Photobacterium angustum]PSW81307.1 DUF4440 domain-containing protein [Photobacterium angustum]
MDILIEQEIALHHYEVRQNLSEINRLLHHSFIEVGKSGCTYDFSSIVDIMQSESPSNSKVHSQDFECVELATATKLLLYKSAVIDEYGEVNHFAKRSSIWVFTGTCWQLKYHQGTPCSPFELEHN